MSLGFERLLERRSVSFLAFINHKNSVTDFEVNIFLTIDARLFQEPLPALPAVPLLASPDST